MIISICPYLKMTRDELLVLQNAFNSERRTGAERKGGAQMEGMRYRKPSVKTVLGVTTWKKRLNRALGITTLLRPFRALKNYQRRLLRRAGYYSPAMKALRAAQRGQVPGPIGPIQMEHAAEYHREPEQHPLAETALLAAALSQGATEEHSRRQSTQSQPASDLAQAMLLATTLEQHNQEHEQEDSRHQQTTSRPASPTRA